MKIALLGVLAIVLLAPEAALASFQPPPGGELSAPGSFQFYIQPSDSPSSQAVRIPVILNQSVEFYIDYFRSEKVTFQQGLNNAAPYLPLMKEIFRAENLPEELVYIVMIESWFNHSAISRASAVGPWQFMAATGEQYRLRTNEWIDERRDPIKSTLAAARYLRALQERLGSWQLVLAAYNAGIGKVRRAMLRTGSEDFWDLKESPYLELETKQFVPKIIAATLIARDPVVYGFSVPMASPLRFDVEIIDRSLDLHSVAAAVGSTYRVLRSLNPELRGQRTPPGVYFLRIPAGTSGLLRALRDGSPIQKKSRQSFNWSVGSSENVLRQQAALFRETKVTLAERHDKPVARRITPTVLYVRTRKVRKSRSNRLLTAGIKKPAESDQNFQAS